MNLEGLNSITNDTKIINAATIDKSMFTNNTATINYDQEYHDYLGIGEKEVNQIIVDFYNDRMKYIEKHCPEYFKEQMKKDVNLVFETIIADLVTFSCQETHKVYSRIISEMERVISDTRNRDKKEFYDLPFEKRQKINTDSIISKIPTSQVKYYSDFIQKEITSPFTIYKDFIEKIIAQDFTISGKVIKIQYNNTDAFINIEIPDILLTANKQIIRHLTILYVERNHEKINNTDAIVEIEDSNYRFQILYSNLSTNNDIRLFIRKNVQNTSGDKEFKVDVDKYVSGVFKDENEFTSEDKQKFVDGCFRITDIQRNANDWLEAAKDLCYAINTKNTFVVGPTGSGKTTFLTNTINMGPEERNLITIEDAPELIVNNSLGFKTDLKHTIYDIFKSSLRMNPSRVIIGETRDKTILDILETCLTALCSTTVHATTIEKFFARIRLMCPNELISSEDLAMVECAAIDVIIFIEARKITGVYIRNDKAFKGDQIECYDCIYSYDVHKNKKRK